MQKTLWTLRYHWKTIVFWLATVVAFSVAYVAHAAILEMPTPNAWGLLRYQSGIGVISGWKCEAHGPLTVRFDNGPAIPLAYENERRDTEGVCGDTNNGFVAIMNWNLLGDGEHTAVVYDNGVEFDRATFWVVTPGTEFLRGVTGEAVGVLSNGQTVRLSWSEAWQGFKVTEFVTPTVGSGNGGCTSRTLTATVYDSRGGQATWTIELDCEYPDKLYLDIIAHTDFSFSFTGLSFEQDGHIYKGSDHVYDNWIDKGADYTAGETDGLELEREPGSPLDFTQPFVMSYYGKEVVTFP